MKPPVYPQRFLHTYTLFTVSLYHFSHKIAIHGFNKDAVASDIKLWQYCSNRKKTDKRLQAVFFPDARELVPDRLCKAVLHILEYRGIETYRAVFHSLYGRIDIGSVIVRH